jgi:hypothetical protein
MRKNKFLIYFLTGIMLFNLSCEEVKEENPIIRAEDYYGDGSFFIELARLSQPELLGNHCGSTQVFELRNDDNLQEFGTVVISNDGRYLNLQCNLIARAVFDNWRIAATLVWIGKSEDWPYGKKGPLGGWSAYPDIEVVRFPDRPTIAVHQIPLEDWMFEDCFRLAVRLSLEDPELNRTAPKALVNHDSYSTYSWNDPFCLEKCIDPGTHSSDYWKNNPDVWPYGLTIGNSFYSIELAIQALYEGESSQDVTYTLFEQIVAAKLNVALGNNSYCIAETIEDADAWLEQYGPVGSGITSTSSAWDEGRPLYLQLTNYNAGFLCADPAQ